MSTTNKMGSDQHRLVLSAIKVGTATTLLAMGLCALASPAREEPAAERVSATNRPPAALGRVQAELDAAVQEAKGQLASVVQEMEAALASREVDRAYSASNIAARVRLLSKDLAEDSRALRAARALRDKMAAHLQSGQKQADGGGPAADIYAAGLAPLQAELTQLTNGLSSVEGVRKSIMEKADKVEAQARAISWLEEAEQLETASVKFRACIEDLRAFAQRVDAALNKLRVSPAPVT